MHTRIAVTLALAAATAAVATFIAPGASALAIQRVALTEVCANGGPSNHLLVDESFSGLGPSPNAYPVDIDRPADCSIASGNELGWVANSDGTRSARVNFEVTGS